MSTIHDRASLCSFTFADGRRCRTPRQSGHPQFCCFHARKQAQLQAAEGLGRDFAFLLSGDYFSACDLATALGRLFAAVARGDVKPKAAATLAYLAQTLLLTIQAAEHEYTNAFGSQAWRNTVYSHVKQNQKYLAQNPAQPAPPPAQPACSAGFTPASSSASVVNQQPSAVTIAPPESAPAAAGLPPGSPSASSEIPRPPRKPRLKSADQAPQPTSVSAQPSLPVEAGLQPASSAAPSACAPQPAPPPQEASPNQPQCISPSTAPKPATPRSSRPRRPRSASTPSSTVSIRSPLASRRPSANLGTGPSGLPLLAPLPVPAPQKPSDSNSG